MLKYSKKNHENIFINKKYELLPNIKICKKIKNPLKKFNNFIINFKGSIIFSVKNESRKKKLENILKKINIFPTFITKINLIEKSGFFIIFSKLKNGFIDNIKNQAIICEEDLLRNSDKKIFNPKIEFNQDKFFQLSKNKILVHIKYGIGKFLGLKTLKIGKIESEYIKILYADNDKLYVPVSSINLISIYLGNDTKNISLNKLGNNSWKKTKKKTIKKINDVAAELLKIYAKRASKKGYKFYKVKDYESFCKQFLFKTTLDQKKAIKEVLEDMYKPIAMDRLICGDVGFGKTEVAMRAAFIAIKNKKQVAVLVPTTLLAQQHFNNFCNRFNKWKVSIEMLSRFRTKKEEKMILKNLFLGKINILIGTHKLLHNTMKWFDLGLLIIDEEHRFGVRDKEKIKKIRTNIDVLTLTATPIPRTLNMSINGIKDLSIISTPPEKRLPVKTFICEYNSQTIRKAILKEVIRGGQVYYVYNDIENIENIQKKLKELVPESCISIGHGKMQEKDLESVMNDFNNQRFNVLLCTTIIETGIDVPNANTIIIERADQFGLAQLYQLRGRVGRSHRQAYAWLLTPHPKMLGKNANKRLKAISDLEELGSGFTLATQDLEIRGTGEILGEEQSGQIKSIGLSLYSKILKKAIISLQEEKKICLNDLEDQKIEIEIQVPALFPNTFMSDVNVRLYFYQKIAYAKNINILNNIKIEIINQFGLLPDISYNLFILSELRLYCKKIGINRIKSNEKNGFIEFSKKHNINPIFLKNLLENYSKNFQILSKNKLYFQNQDLFILENRIIWIYNFIKKILNHLL